ncbi:MAG: extracellular solute-binding protein [Phycisphaerales bacterium]
MPASTIHDRDACASGSAPVGISRRDAIRLAAGSAAALALGACSRRDDLPRVVLYSSVDDVYLREIAAAYERDSGVRVDLVGDTEATKSTGLAERVIAERARPRADVWWSSEPFFTIRLASEGLLEPGAARAALGDDVAARWPDGMMSADGSWVGFAARARVIVYRASRFGDGPDQIGRVPRNLGELTDPAYRGRVAMARPEFGTTRGHLAALIESEGAAAVEAWLGAMKANALRVYPGNSSVVRAVAQGEADLGLTDTDDVWAGQRNGWDVEAAFEEAEVPRLSSGLTPGPGSDTGPPREARSCCPTPPALSAAGRTRTRGDACSPGSSAGTPSACSRPASRGTTRCTRMRRTPASSRRCRRAPGVPTSRPSPTILTRQRRWRRA